MASTPPVLIDLPWLGSGLWNKKELTGNDLLAPFLDGISKPTDVTYYAPTLMELEFMDRIPRILAAIAEKALTPYKLMVPETGSTGPLVFPPSGGGGGAPGVARGRPRRR